VAVTFIKDNCNLFGSTINSNSSDFAIEKIGILANSFISLIKVTATNLKIMPNIILEYMKALPETPYKAVGFNYSYEIETKTRIEDILKPEKTKLSEILSKDFKMGGIIFYKFKDFLSRMNFQPINGNKIVVNFNFHFNTDNKKIIFKKLEQHVSTWVKAEKIVNGLFNV
jgi:hypothetical protein